MGHFVFTRRVRYLPDKKMQGLQRHSIFHVDQKKYTFFESYKSEVIYVAGELTWIAKKSDMSTIRDAIAPPFMFTQEIRNNETEYYLSEYIAPEIIHKNFKTTYQTQRSKHFKHPAQPFTAPIKQAISQTSRIALIIATLLLVFLMLFGNGKEIYQATLNMSEINQGTLSKNITINNPKHIIELNYKANLNATWKNYDITLLKDKVEVFSFKKQLVRHNYSNKNWTEGKQSGNARFKVKKSGDYLLRIHATKGNTGKKAFLTQRDTLTISIKEGVMGKKYIVYLFIISLISYIWFYLSRSSFEKKRWEEEDD
jgi:hypothetical protein